MPKYVVYWETDYGEGREYTSHTIITADNKTDAVRKFSGLNIRKACVVDIQEIKEKNYG